MIKVGLVGNPNCGKTTLFNLLTGSTAHVGNWPGVTVDKREGTYKKLDEKINIVDLPGIYSLSPYTPEEIVSRNFILDEKPDCLINIVDATNLERNLYLTTQVLEINVPVVLALNMIDVVESSGDIIKVDELQKQLGVKIVEISALKNKGIDELMKVVLETCKKPREATSVLSKTNLNSTIQKAERLLAEINVDNPLFHAIKLIEADEVEVKMHEAQAKEIENLKKMVDTKEFEGDFEAVIADLRYKFISESFVKSVLKKTKK